MDTTRLPLTRDLKFSFAIAFICTSEPEDFPMFPRKNFSQIEKSNGFILRCILIEKLIRAP